MTRYDKEYAQELWQDHINELPPKYRDGSLIFTYYASFTGIFSPDMLNLLWLNFQDYKKGQQLQSIPTIAVSDLIQSNICQEVALKLYELDKDVSQYLRDKINNLCKERELSLLYNWGDIASFTLQFADNYYKRPSKRHLYSIYRIKSLFVLDKGKATEEIRTVVDNINKSDRAKSDDYQILIQLAENQSQRINSEQSQDKLPTFSLKDEEGIEILDQRLKDRILKIIDPYDGKTEEDTKLVKELIEENLKSKNPYLELGNCGLDGTEDILEMLSQCLHLETLILSNEWAEYKRETDCLILMSSKNNGLSNSLIQIPNHLPKNLKSLILAGDEKNPGHIQNLTPLSHLTLLHTLDLRFNEVQNLSPLSNLSQLQKLYMEHNHIQDITVIASLKKLQELNLRKNQLQDISILSQNINLIYLDLSSNNPDNIEYLQFLLQLEILYLEYNQVKDITFLGSIIRLKHLYLRGNQIEEFPITLIDELTSLEHLILCENPIQNIPMIIFNRCKNCLPDLKNHISSNLLKPIQVLYIEQELQIELQEGNLDKIMGLRESRNNFIMNEKGEIVALNLSWNKISDLTFLSELKALTHLDLGGNQIEDISPLTSLINLRVLILARNNIANPKPLKSLVNVEIIYLDVNKIYVITNDFLLKLSRLNELYLKGNPIQNVPPKIFDKSSNCLEELRTHFSNNIDENELIVEIKAYRKALKSNPNNFDLLNLLGVAYSKSGDTESAVFTYQKAIEVNPNQYIALHNLAELYHRKEDKKLALELYQRVLKISPNFDEALNGIGVVYYDEKNYNSAIQFFQKALAINPKSYRTAYNLGNAYYQLGQIDFAFEYLQRSLSINPNYAEALNNLGQVYEKRGDLKQATEVYQRALSVKPEYLSPSRNLASVYSRQKEFSQAILILKKALETYPNSQELYNDLGLVYLEKGDIDKSVNNFKQALKIEPSYKEAIINLSKSYQATSLQKTRDIAEHFNMILSTFRRYVKKRVITPHSVSVANNEANLYNKHYVAIRLEIFTILKNNQVTISEIGNFLADRFGERDELLQEFLNDKSEEQIAKEAINEFKSKKLTDLSEQNTDSQTQNKILGREVSNDSRARRSSGSSMKKPEVIIVENASSQKSHSRDRIKQIITISKELPEIEKRAIISTYYESHFDSLTAFATRKLGDKDSAQSVVQDSFNVLLKRILEKDEYVYDLKQYMITIILMNIRGLQRRYLERPHSDLDDVEGYIEPDENQIERYETNNVLQEIVNQAQLNEDQLTLLECLLKGYNPQEIVNTMNLASKEEYRKARFSLIRKLKTTAAKMGINSFENFF